MISGPSGCGKTSFTQRLLKEGLFKEKPKETILCVPKNSSHILGTTFNDYKEACPEIQIIEGLFNPEDIRISENSPHMLIIYDDCYSQVAENHNIYILQTFTARKANISTIIITQNPFQA